MKKIEIFGMAITSSHGTLTTGQKLDVSDEFAAHLVEQCRVAKYIEQPSIDNPIVPESAKTADNSNPRKPPKQKFDEAEETTKTDTTISE